MLRRLFAAVFCLLLLPAVGSADTGSGSRATQLDALFEQLLNAPDEPTARQIEDQIWRHWMRSGDPEIDVLMSQAQQARRWYDYEKAISLLDRIIARKPDYAEAWNQRATVHFNRGDYEASLVDIAETLAREPRHFGSLAGRGVIRLKQGKVALAMQNIRAAMKFHPYLRERHMFPGLANPQLPAR